MHNLSCYEYLIVAIIIMLAFNVTGTQIDICERMRNVAYTEEVGIIRFRSENATPDIEQLRVHVTLIFNWNCFHFQFVSTYSATMSLLFHLWLRVYYNNLNAKTRSILIWTSTQSRTENYDRNYSIMCIHNKRELNKFEHNC